LGLQIGFYGWQPDFAAASGFIPPALSCASYTPHDPQNQNIAEFCDPAIDAKIAEAQALQATDPSGASRLWTKIDHDLTDRAPWVPFANGVVVSVRSKRVGNYQYNPQWGTLFDQLWVR
jgi:peptide/nickel transport system substrate-binding protein